MSCVFVSTMSCVYFVNYVPDSFINHLFFVSREIDALTAVNFTLVTLP